MPTAWAGVKPWNGKPNPVKLVATVVVRNVAVQPSSRLRASRPYITISPERMPIKLSATCTNVKIAKNMGSLQQELLTGYGFRNASRSALT